MKVIVLAQLFGTNQRVISNFNSPSNVRDTATLIQRPFCVDTVYSGHLFPGAVVLHSYIFYVPIDKEKRKTLLKRFSFLCHFYLNFRSCSWIIIKRIQMQLLVMSSFSSNNPTFFFSISMQVI